MLDSAPPTLAPGMEGRETYPSLMGSLIMYVGCNTKPDISAALSILGQVQRATCHMHLTALKKALHYLTGILSHGLALGVHRSVCR